MLLTSLYSKVYKFYISFSACPAGQLSFDKTFKHVSFRVSNIAKLLLKVSGASFQNESVCVCVCMHVHILQTYGCMVSYIKHIKIYIFSWMELYKIQSNFYKLTLQGTNENNWVMEVHQKKNIFSQWTFNFNQMFISCHYFKDTLAPCRDRVALIAHMFPRQKREYGSAGPMG